MSAISWKEKIIPVNENQKLIFILTYNKIYKIKNIFINSQLNFLSISVDEQTIVHMCFYEAKGQKGSNNNQYINNKICFLIWNKYLISQNVSKIHYNFLLIDDSWLIIINV